MWRQVRCEESAVEALDNRLDRERWFNHLEELGIHNQLNVPVVVLEPFSTS